MDGSTCTKSSINPERNLTRLFRAKLIVAVLHVQNYARNIIRKKKQKPVVEKHPVYVNRANTFAFCQKRAIIRLSRLYTIVLEQQRD